jgi:hypothetical protein
VEPWTDPHSQWHRGTDSLRHYQTLVNGAELLTRWEPAPFEFAPTDCFKLGDDFWIWQPGVGGIRFNAAEPSFSAFPSETVDPAWFEHLIERSWMPAVYQAWGRQVLHASAVAEDNTGRVVAFTGPSGAGKSTLAYGLGQRPGWAHVADDTLAFSVEGGSITLHPLKNDARLRPATAAYHGRSDAPFQPIIWPDRALSLSRLFVIVGADDLTTDAVIEPLTAVESYTLLLQQAHSFTLQIPAFNQQLMRDYLALTAGVSIARLTYRRSFDQMEAILDVIERTVGQ